MSKDGKGYLLPSVIDPGGKLCVCVPVPNDPNHIRAFLGQLDALAKWYTWEKDDAHTGRLVAEVWRDVAAQVREAMSLDCGCGGPVAIPTNQRYTADGLLEVSYDGGTTWESGSGIDPRFNSPLMPPLPGSSEDQRCNTAWSASTFLQESIYDQLAMYSTATAIITLVGSALAIVLTGGVATPLIVALAGNILGFGISAVDSALTVDVWDTFSCLLYCRLEDNGTMTEEGFLGLQQDISSEFTGIVPQVLNDAVRAFGPAGLVNAGRAIRQTANDCEACECNDCGASVCVTSSVHRTQGEDVDAWSAPPISTASADGGTQAIRGGTQSMFLEGNVSQCVMAVSIRVRANLQATSQNPVFITMTAGDFTHSFPYRGVSGGTWVTKTITFPSYQYINKIDFNFGSGSEITTINWVDVRWCDD